MSSVLETEMVEGDLVGMLGVDVLRLGGTITGAGGVVFGVGITATGGVPFARSEGVVAVLLQPAPASEAAITRQAAKGIYLCVI